MHLHTRLHTATKRACSWLLPLLAVGALTSAHAQLAFTQYYEGNTGTNKWIEIKNVGTTAISLSDYTLSLFTNAAAENWKTGGAATQSFALSGSLSAGAVYLLGNTANTTPSGITANTTSNAVINFNGNDSIVLWNDAAAFSTSRITDALSFTNAGNQGADKSFVRTSLATGYDLTTGTSITNYGSVWQIYTLVAVASATSGQDAHLGSSSLSASAVPEPSTYAAIFGGVALIGAIVHRRRRSSAAR